MKPPLDVRLYLITDRGLAGTRSLEDLVRAAVRGGVTAVQLREKDCSTQEFVHLSKQLKKVLAPAGISLIVNDRVDVALAAGADGVHVGQSDMDCRDVRKILGPDSIVGLSVETERQAEEAEGLDVDYLGVSPIFHTSTKTDTGIPWGIEGLARLRHASRCVLVGVGGVNAENAAQVMNTGADGIAVVSAICSAPDPEEASRELRRIVDAARKKTPQN